MSQTSLFPGMPEQIPVDHRHAAERAAFEQVLGNQPWRNEFMALLDEGWGWRDAAFIAWYATPRNERQPENQEEFCNLIGISTRGMSERRRRNPAINVRAAKLTAQRALEHIDGVMNALVESAQNPSYKHHPDRKLFLELANVYTPRQELDLGLQKQSDDFSHLADDELQRMAMLGESSDTG